MINLSPPPATTVMPFTDRPVAATRLPATTAAALTATLALAGVAGCGGHDSPSAVEAPGEPKTVTGRALDAGAALIQDKPPVAALNTYVDGFHFHSGAMHAQMEAHHYCSMLNDDVIQCVIYDGNVRQAKLVGIEYIISARLFARLPLAEKPLWHSHVHEVKSGQLVAPGLPAAAEHALMSRLVGTYGKTWHTWHTDMDLELPLGVPHLMMAFTADGQADADMVRARDQRLGIDSNERREQRADIPAPAIDPAADAWQRGQVIQLTDPTGQHHSPPAHRDHDQQDDYRTDAAGSDSTGDAAGDAGASADANAGGSDDNTSARPHDGADSIDGVRAETRARDDGKAAGAGGMHS